VHRARSRPAGGARTCGNLAVRVAAPQQILAGSGRTSEIQRNHRPQTQPLLAVKPAEVRSLDAVHLGTALHSRRGLTSFVTYDKRLLDAAQAAGLPVDSPT
jgi:hypothetical protein